jgi:hypothetical protein
MAYGHISYFLDMALGLTLKLSHVSLLPKKNLNFRARLRRMKRNGESLSKRIYASQADIEVMAYSHAP